jgi:hypothetical protein
VARRKRLAEEDKRTNKTQNPDDYDANQSLFARASCNRHHRFSKTTHFADISF